MSKEKSLLAWSKTCQFTDHAERPCILNFENDTLEIFLEAVPNIPLTLNRALVRQLLPALQEFASTDDDSDGDEPVDAQLAAIQQALAIPPKKRACPASPSVRDYEHDYRDIEPSQPYGDD